MKAVFLSLLVAVGVFVAFVLLGFIAGVVIELQNQTLDANGITLTPNDANVLLASQVQGFAIIAGLILGAIGGIVFGVNRRQVREDVTNATR